MDPRWLTARQALHHVRTTIVDGRVLMRDRELLTIDGPAVVGAMGEGMPALLDRRHGKRIQDYDT